MLFTILLQVSMQSNIGISKNNYRNNIPAYSTHDFRDIAAFISSKLMEDTRRDDHVEHSSEDQPDSLSVSVGEYLTNSMEADFPSLFNPVHSNFVYSDDVRQLPINSYCNQNDSSMKVDVSQTMPEQAVEDSLGKVTSESTFPENQEKNGNAQSFDGCPVFEPDFAADEASRKLQSEISMDQIVQALEGYCQNAEAKSYRTLLEASQFQRGISRRRLHFEEFQSPSIPACTHLSSSMNNTLSSRSPTYSGEQESLDSSRVGLILSSRGKQVSKPLGIGLHLNRIAHTLPVGRSATVSIKPTGTMSNNLVENENNYKELSNFIEKIPKAAEDWMIERRAPMETSSAISGTFFGSKSFNMLQQLDHRIMPQSKRKFYPELADNFEEFHQSSPNKQRKKSLVIDGVACKRCNCKKSKCLKLYCDCFAAGAYCAESCACLECLNRLDYEDTVLDIRQQIESRNPDAFAPKIVQHEDGNRSMPISARHKTGCNCKKSMCLKKYCECYQANVGCSSGCRCEGCRNVYGKKKEYGMTEEKRSNIEQLEHTADDKLEMTPASEDLTNVELYDLHHLAPLTPSLEYLSRGQGGLRSRLGAGRYVLTPDSDFSMLPSPARSKNSSSYSRFSDVLSERRKEDLDAVPRTKYSIAEMMDQFLSRYNTLDHISGLTPAPNPASVTMVASSPSSKSSDWANVSRLQSCPESGRPLDFGDSLHWHCSPITPMTLSGETRNQEQGSQNGLHITQEDDTPEILKEAFVSSIPSVKVSSPNKKRVSPPRSLIHHFASNSSGNMKSTRRFILKSLPPTQTVTPSTDSKDSPDKKR